MEENCEINIQNRTKEDENIKLLKLRDILYDKAKQLNNTVIILSILPIIYTIIVNNLDLEIFDLEKVLGLDEFGIIIALLVSSIIFILSSKINKHKLNSNILRQAYDCRVFSIRGNKFIIPETTQMALDNINLDKKDKARYEDWYHGDFSSGWCHNVLICQVDNLLYTMYLYSRLKKTMDRIIWILGLSIMTAITYGLYQGLVIEVFFKLVVPLSPIIAIVFTTWSKLKDNIYDYDSKLKTIKDDVEKGIVDIIYLEAIQDKILINRLNDVLVPKLLREHYLKSGNEYKIELKEFNEFIIERNL